MKKISKAPPKPSNAALIAPFVLAVLAGILLRVFYSGSCESIKSEFVDPVASVFLKTLTLIIAPIIVCSQITTIAGFDGMHELKPLAKLFFKRMCFVLFAVAVVSIVIGMLLWGRIDNSSVNMGVGFSLKRLDVPDSILSPLLSSDLLQIIVLSTVFGLGLLSLGEKKERLTLIFSDITDVFTYILRIFCKLMPLFIFVSILSIVLTLKAGVFANLMLLLLTLHLTIAGVLLIYTVFVAKSTRTKPSFLFKSLLSPLLIAFATASSFAARNEMYDAAKAKLCIQDQVSYFTINIGSLVFWPPLVVLNSIFVIFAGRVFSLPTLISLPFIVIFIILATPNVAGGSLVTAATMFSLAGIDPVAALPIYVFVILVLDNTGTAGSVYCLMLESYYCNHRLYGRGDGE